MRETPSLQGPFSRAGIRFDNNQVARGSPAKQAAEVERRIKALMNSLVAANSEAATGTAVTYKAGMTTQSGTKLRPTLSLLNGPIGENSESRAARAVREAENSRAGSYKSLLTFNEKLALQGRVLAVCAGTLAPY